MAKFRTPEFQAQLARDMLDHAAEQNAGVEWECFVQEVHARRMGIKLNCDATELLRGPDGHIFGVMVIMYYFVPFVAIPFWAWRQHDWWLLAGIVASKIGTRVEAQRTKKPVLSTGTIFGIVALILWYFIRSNESVWTFFILCGAWGMWWYRLAEEFQCRNALKTLVTRKDEFERYKAANQFYVVLADRAGNTYRRIQIPGFKR